MLARGLSRGVVEVKGSRQHNRRILEVHHKPANGVGCEGTEATTDTPVNNSLRVILARLLLKTQGATLACATGQDGSWSAVIDFPLSRS
jgi:hypothetical protein